MRWIRKDYAHPSHHTVEPPERVEVDGTYAWRGKTACGRTITGLAGETILTGIECTTCHRIASTR